MNQEKETDVADDVSYDALAEALRVAGEDVDAAFGNAAQAKMVLDEAGEDDPDDDLEGVQDAATDFQNAFNEVLQTLDTEREGLAALFRAHHSEDEDDHEALTDDFGDACKEFELALAAMMKANAAMVKAKTAFDYAVQALGEKRDAIAALQRAYGEDAEGQGTSNET